MLCLLEAIQPETGHGSSGRQALRAAPLAVPAQGLLTLGIFTRPLAVPVHRLLTLGICTRPSLRAANTSRLNSRRRPPTLSIPF